MEDRQLESWGGHGDFFHMTGEKGQLLEDVQTEITTGHSHAYCHFHKSFNFDNYGSDPCED